MKPEKIVVCVIGVGRVGLPLALAFSRKVKVIGFDIDGERVRRLNKESRHSRLRFTTDPQKIGQADFVILCVPTPLTGSKLPDLTQIRRSAEMVREMMKPGAVVVLESSVYPGVTEEVVGGILESSGLRRGVDFKLAYSPERVNPGDPEHDVDKITKVVSGSDDETAELVAQLYSLVAPSVFKARDIRTAEAAKLVENIQRDVNIALMNELSLIFERLSLSTRDVLQASATKWNFHKYHPGLVGGHCIPFNPHYLTFRARQAGASPKLIPLARTINEELPDRIVVMMLEALVHQGKKAQGSRVLIMGLTYKANISDTGETLVPEVAAGLERQGVEVLCYDPLIEGEGKVLGLTKVGHLEQAQGTDAIIMAVGHAQFSQLSLVELRHLSGEKPVLMDMAWVFSEQKARELGFYCLSL